MFTRPYEPVSWSTKKGIRKTIHALLPNLWALNIPKPCFASLSDKDDACPTEEGYREPNVGKERKQGLRKWSCLAWE